MLNINVAVDGPAGAGKSTTARAAAIKLDLKYLDTGAMYRALTWKGIDNKINFQQSRDIEELAVSTRIRIEKGPGGSNIIYLDDIDVTREIRTPAVNDKVSLVAKNQIVRNVMVAQQQQMAREGGVIMDGRDIGTNVLPQADFKFFLNASLKERAYRRYLELIQHGYQVTLKEVEKEISMRDKIDKEREFAPLIAAEDAIIIDTTRLSIDEVVESMVNHVKKIGAGNI
ncbi:MAG: (d)CMP kinase [Candidatus Syntrophonatronum acetioxidans]|uniref:Cytidylate kinase n=1 Tax=Candidatus Syntrophonatronum acetioxidans TaxID=1795816 RepID=A0A424YBX1_9FIRM|nr:MAG: (d)CMP kinase [Candidatus Syntrophonatronum acetioxidans]